jgi:methyltransferase (TIGR00027 family)
MTDEMGTEPDNTAVRTALWRALHLEVDAPPFVLEDRIGLQLVAPEQGWQQRGDMHPVGTARARASILGRARFVEDLVVAEAERGVTQYVILGAGLDTFALRRPEVASRVRVFEIDEPPTQAWKRRRLVDLGIGVPDWLYLAPVDFETGQSWRDALEVAGFDASGPAVVASTGVSMYLTREANEATLREVASLARGSTLAMSFLLTKDLMDEDVRQLMGARASGTPFISFYRPEEIVGLARDAGFSTAEHVSAAMLNERYFAGRTDGLRMSKGEELVVARI